MNKETFLNYLYSNNYNNVYEHALNICNSWGLGYAISSIGEHIPIIQPKRTIYDIYNENLLNINNNLDDVTLIIEKDKILTEGGSYMTWENQLIWNNDEYTLIKFDVSYSLTYEDELIEYIPSINGKYNIGWGMISLIDSIMYPAPIENSPTDSIDIIYNNQTYNEKYPYGLRLGNTAKGIVFPYFNYYVNWKTPIRENNKPTAEKIFTNFEDTAIYTEEQKWQYNNYLYLLDMDKKIIHTAINKNNEIIEGKTLNVDFYAPQIPILYLITTQSIISPYTIEYKINFNNNITNEEKEWFKTITI